MSRISLGIIPSILIIILSVFFYFSPQILGQKPAGNTQVVNELVTKRYLSIGNAISGASFVVDAIIDEMPANLEEIISNLCQKEPEITTVHFTDADNKVIASSDPNMVEKFYTTDILRSGTSGVKESGGLYEAGFSIDLGPRRIGTFYFQAKPKIPEIEVAIAPNPIILGLGVLFALIAFLISFAMSRGLESKLVEEINKRQEEIFLPRIDSLKREQATAEKTVAELNKMIATAQQNLKALENEYLARKQEMEASPVVQSVEKLKASESELLKRLESLKEEESRLNKEIALLTQQREDVSNALAAEKREESLLREKLELIKKKILHLETPG